MMKYAYFNPLVMAVEDVDAGVFAQLKSTVADAHAHVEHNDAGNPDISVRGGQQIQIVPNEFKYSDPNLFKALTLNSLTLRSILNADSAKSI